MQEPCRRFIRRLPVSLALRRVRHSRSLTCPRPWPSHRRRSRRRRKPAPGRRSSRWRLRPTGQSGPPHTPVSGSTSSDVTSCRVVARQFGDHRADLLVSGCHQEGRRAAVGFGADNDETGLGMREFGDAVRRDGAAGMEIRIDQRRKLRRRLDGGVELDTQFAQERADRAGSRSSRRYGRRQARIGFRRAARRYADAIAAGAMRSSRERRQHCQPAVRPSPLWPQGQAHRVPATRR